MFQETFGVKNKGGKMKIAIIAHSAVHPRQQKFYESIAKQGNDVLVLGPRRWNN